MANIERYPWNREAAELDGIIVAVCSLCRSSDGVIPDPNTGDNQHCWQPQALRCPVSHDGGRACLLLNDTRHNSLQTGLCQLEIRQGGCCRRDHFSALFGLLYRPVLDAAEGGRVGLRNIDLIAEESAIRHFGGRRGRLTVSELLIMVVLIILALAVVLPLLLPWFRVQDPSGVFYNRGFAKADLVDELQSVDCHTNWTRFLNTLKVCGCSPVHSTSAAMAGYIFAKYRSRWTEVAFYVVLMGYFVPVHMVLIPLYQLNTKFGLVDSMAGVFLPMTAFGIPFWTIIYRSFFRSLPDDLAEAAKIDGAGHFDVFLRVMFPLAKPATVLAVLLVFIGAWRLPVELNHDQQPEALYHATANSTVYECLRSRPHA